MKYKLLGLTATAVVGSSLFATMVEAESIKVKSGDTLWELSKEYNTTVDLLKRTNGLSSDMIRIGQILELPGTTTSKTTTKTTTSETVTAAPTKTQSATVKSTTYKVKAGDSLWVIARSYNTSVNELKRLNSLSSDLIRVGQTLIINKSNATTSQETEQTPKQSTTPKPTSKPESSKENSAPSTTTSTYTVKPGDSLWKIANQHNLSIAEIKVANNLSSDTIYIGQALKLSGNAIIKNETNNNTVKDNSSSSAKVNTMIGEAKNLMGTPYRWAGNTPAGFDCSGFIYYVLNKVTSVSRLSTAGYWDIMSPVNSPAVGDFVFFTTYKAGPSHMGIYLGNNEFIHASNSGVAIGNLTNSYWKQRYLGAKRYLN
ncbi:C40 family peptidase [Metabacillus malikii]|uniref:LysM repeat protein n=1 Tax=Metabacillus malikii TaxID=1504265 RepID=A0ABT9Z9I2_9BACI|nr:peptidoglycan endopeptidase [Metabacillus malikii]MDQ0228914.1 LysM repeat protein [Metabacillus malikii]